MHTFEGHCSASHRRDLKASFYIEQKIVSQSLLPSGSHFRLPLPRDKLSND